MACSSLCPKSSSETAARLEVRPEVAAARVGAAVEFSVFELVLFLVLIGAGVYGLRHFGVI